MKKVFRKPVALLIGVFLCVKSLYAEDQAEKALRVDTQQEVLQLLLTGGVYHGDEITAEDNQKWFGLFPQDGKWVLKETKITVRVRPDELYDETPENATGKSVSIDNEKREPLFLIRGLSALKDGPVDSVILPSEENTPGGQRSGERLFPGMTKHRSFHKTEYTLFASGQVKLPEQGESWVNPGIADYQLHLFRAGKSKPYSHTFIHFPLLGAEAQPPALLWAGDLDRDGDLDLFLSTSDHYNVSEVTLFLSSLSRSDGLIGKAAVFSTTGC